MKGVTRFAACLAGSLWLLLSAQPACASDPAALAFVDVNVVPMDTERVETHRTVIVRGHTIVADGPVGSTAIAIGVQRVEGGGKAFLMPGLADMHTHVSDEDDIGLYVAYGVTTVLHMGGTEQRIVGAVRNTIARGDLVGPQMFFSLMVDGPNDFGVEQVNNAEQASYAVRLAKANGYDFIKVYNELLPEAFDALVDEGRRQGLPVIGHQVKSVGLPAALFRGQVMVAHAEEFLDAAFMKDPKTVAAVVAEVKRSGAFVTPTLSTYRAISEQWGDPSRVQAYLAAPEARYMSPTTRLRWKRSFYMRRGHADLLRALAFQRRFTAALQAAGVPLLAGTDSPDVPGMYPGLSVHSEMKELVASGLTPFQAISAATRTAGAFIAQSHPERQDFGVVRLGGHADLLLVDHNPLQSVEGLDHPLGVMAAGRWYDRKELDHLLSERKARYAHLDRVN